MDSSRITRRRWIAGTGSALASSTLRRTRNLFGGRDLVPASHRMLLVGHPWEFVRVPDSRN